MNTKSFFNSFTNKDLPHNQKIMRDLWCHHLGALLTPVYFFFYKGFDVRELWVTSISIGPFLLLSYLFFRGEVLTKPCYPTPEYKYMRGYFWIMVLSVTIKAFAPNVLNPLMIFVYFTTEVLFVTYLLILHWGGFNVRI